MSKIIPVGMDRIIVIIEETIQKLEAIKQEVKAMQVFTSKALAENIELKDFNFSTRVKNALARNGIATTQELLMVSVNQLYEIDHLGTTSADEIRTKLKAKGLFLIDDDIRKQAIHNIK